MRGKVLVDLRNVYDRDEAEEAGLTYFGIGRGRPKFAEPCFLHPKGSIRV